MPLPLLQSLAAALATACCWPSLAQMMIPSVAARRHHLFVGNLNLPAAIHSLVFDDESFQLNVSRNMVADSSHAWITFNVSSFLASCSVFAAVCRQTACLVLSSYTRVSPF